MHLNRAAFLASRCAHLFRQGVRRLPHASSSLSSVRRLLPVSVSNHKPAFVHTSKAPHKSTATPPATMVRVPLFRVEVKAEKKDSKTYTVQMTPNVGGGRYKETNPIHLTRYHKVLIAHRDVAAQIMIRELTRFGIPYVLAEPGTYTNQASLIQQAKANGCDGMAVQWGYESENPEFSDACAKNEICFLGPPGDALRALGNKMRLKERASQAGVSIAAWSPINSVEDLIAFFLKHGKTQLKAPDAGGGRGQRTIRTVEDCQQAWNEVHAEMKSVYGRTNTQFFAEKFIQNGRHIEFQFVRDQEGNVQLFDERECSVQRRNQKAIEWSNGSLSPTKRAEMQRAVRATLQGTSYVGAGTAEMMMDAETGEWTFMEINGRLQVEHPVTEQSHSGTSQVTEMRVGVNLIESLLRVCNGELIRNFMPTDIRRDRCAIHLRLCAENHLLQPAPGTIQGISMPVTSDSVEIMTCANTGYTVDSNSDNNFGKVTISGATWDETIQCAISFLCGTHISSQTLRTNKQMLLNILESAEFRNNQFTVSTLDAHLLRYTLRTSPLSSDEQVDGLVKYVADMTAKQIKHPGLKEGAKFRDAKVDMLELDETIDEAKQAGTLAPVTVRWRALSGRALINAILNFVAENGPLFTPLDLRDAIQSAIANRMLQRDVELLLDYMEPVFGSRLFSVEMDGGAVPDVASRFIGQLAGTRTALGNKLNIGFAQMLNRAANGVAYSNIPENLLKAMNDCFIDGGVELSRFFDSLNDVDNLMLSAKLVSNRGRVPEVAISYTTDDIDALPSERQYTDAYWYGLIDQIVERMGDSPFILGIKDMASQLTPESISRLVGYIREKYPNLPIHLHPHNNSQRAADVVVAFVEAGGHIADVVTDAYADTHGPLSPILDRLGNLDLNRRVLRAFTKVVGQVRSQYAPFEEEGLGPDETKASKMPGGQWPAYQQQAKATGLVDKDLILFAYRVARHLMGNPPLVTPSSKVAGDFGINAVRSGLVTSVVPFRPLVRQLAEVLTTDPGKMEWPPSVRQYFRGELGTPPFGYPSFRPQVLRHLNLSPISGIPARTLAPFDFEGAKSKLAQEGGVQPSLVTRNDVVYFGMFGDAYKQVFINHWLNYGAVSSHLNGRQYYQGLDFGEAVWAHINGEPVSVALSDAKQVVYPDGSKTTTVKIKVENNGRKEVRVATYDHKRMATDPTKELGSQYAGNLTQVHVKSGDNVTKGQLLYTISVMKMEIQIKADRAFTIGELAVSQGEILQQGQLLLTFAT